MDHEPFSFFKNKTSKLECRSSPISFMLNEETCACNALFLKICCRVRNQIMYCVIFFLDIENILCQIFHITACTAERFFRIDKAQENLHYATDIGHENIYILDAAPLTPDTESTAHPETTTSLDQTGPSMSLETTTGLSVSLDISQSVDTPSAGVSLDVPESHAR